MELDYCKITCFKEGRGGHRGGPSYYWTLLQDCDGLEFVIPEGALELLHKFAETPTTDGVMEVNRRKRGGKGRSFQIARDEDRTKHTAASMMCFLLRYLQLIEL